ncbi:MAG: hypothetical protein GWN18_20470, partial [Thermoplasmata archaeon]|nr:hypothetical protein [Thermoplasmata archaeon]NIT80241.1 hypothetical protein [Thermoplasmata archaeon]NIW84877.1 hypothetical protein [Thermoplasmata archaeon]NIY06609.1 hypothetical protein [Thermoplasmata archaeon]
MDGYFDGGQPEMWTVVGGDTNNANYGLRRFFLDERMNESAQLTVMLTPHTGPGDVVSHVELFSNLNRRDFAVLPDEEDPDSVTPASATTYFRAYPMTDHGDGTYACTIPVTRCGAYRVNARYRVNGGPYVYYTDYGLRRDCAVVVSPRSSLDVTLYEVNPLIVEATSDDFIGRSTF